MFTAALKQIRERIRSKNYLVTLHADEEMDEDEITIFDAEAILLGGKIIERQKDKDTDEWKYLIRGETLDDRTAVVVVKLASTGKAILITVYAE